MRHWPSAQWDEVTFGCHAASVIGVLCPDADLPVAAELFELFKTPWARFEPDRSFDVLVAENEFQDGEAPLVIVYGAQGVRASGRDLALDGARIPIYGALTTIGEGAPLVRTQLGDVVVTRERAGVMTTIRCGYSLLDEVRRLLDEGQPPEHAALPTLDLHIELLRGWILDAGISFVEIPPRPAGGAFVACLTHDIDFLRLRDHRFDHTLAGFLYRATVGSVRDGIRGRRPWHEVGRNLAAAATTPLVKLGLHGDPWRPFESYLEADSPNRSTFFVVPFRGQEGKEVAMPKSHRRAVRYHLEHARPWIELAASQGFEIGVHGIDAWIDPALARLERQRIAEVLGSEPEGVRIHWLCRDGETPRRLEEAGFGYDATVGYNETVGFRAGTLQAYRPLGCSRLLELPLHLQDTSLFYTSRLSLTEPQAWSPAKSVLEHAQALGGVLTVSWHDRSLAPERLWGDFYELLLSTLAENGAVFLTARDAVSLFRARRSVQFDPDHAGRALRVAGGQGAVDAALLVRVHNVSGQAYEVNLRRSQVVELPACERFKSRS